nr:hypothetical protein [Burkholderia plantarii]
MRPSSSRGALQAGHSWRTSRCASTPSSDEAVSYTHLDVYKRQGW